MQVSGVTMRETEQALAAVSVRWYPLVDTFYDDPEREPEVRALPVMARDTIDGAISLNQWRVERRGGSSAQVLAARTAQIQAAR